MVWLLTHPLLPSASCSLSQSSCVGEEGWRRQKTTYIGPNGCLYKPGGGGRGAAGLEVKKCGQWHLQTLRNYTISRVPGFLSIVRIGSPPSPLPQESVPYPWIIGANSADWRESMALCILCVLKYNYYFVMKQDGAGIYRRSTYAMSKIFLSTEGDT